MAAALLREHGIDPTDPNIVRLANTEARQQLQRSPPGGILRESNRDPVVADLLGQPDITLLSFDRDHAYTRKFPGLTTVKLQEGLVDLRRNLPAKDTTLLAPTALLAGRADLHPRVVEQILKIAQSIHGPGSLIDPPFRFPTREGVDVPLHEAAEVYLTQGESFLSRMLPYSLLRWTLILRVLAVSLILWIPLVRFLPEVAGWRVDRRFGRLYTALREAERNLVAARDRGTLRAGIAALDRLFLEAQPLCDGYRLLASATPMTGGCTSPSFARTRRSGSPRWRAGRQAASSRDQKCDLQEGEARPGDQRSGIISPRRVCPPVHGVLERSRAVTPSPRSLRPSITRVR